MTVRTRTPGTDAAPRRRRAVRTLAVALAALTALVYFAFGLNLVSVIDSPADQRIFGLIAGSGYALATLLLLALERRWIYLTGALLQLLVITQYVNLASERVPSYEVWGLALRIPQALLLVALVWLGWRWPPSRTRRPSRKESLP